MPLDVPLTVDVKVGAELGVDDADDPPRRGPGRSRRGARGTAGRRVGRADRVVRMPELPEVETVARDLRPLMAGARITDVRCDWPRTMRGEDVEAFAHGVIGRTDRRAPAGGRSCCCSSCRATGSSPST